MSLAGNLRQAQRARGLYGSSRFLYRPTQQDARRTRHVFLSHEERTRDEPWERGWTRWAFHSTKTSGNSGWGSEWNRHFPEFHSEILSVSSEVGLKFRKIGVTGKFHSIRPFLFGPSFSKPGEARSTYHLNGIFGSFIWTNGTALSRSKETRQIEPYHLIGSFGSFGSQRVGVWVHINKNHGS